MALNGKCIYMQRYAICMTGLIPPILDAMGNIYFAHHFWDPVENRMIEADYCTC
jgi:hypothetical protein